MWWPFRKREKLTPEEREYQYLWKPLVERGIRDGTFTRDSKTGLVRFTDSTRELTYRLGGTHADAVSLIEHAQSEARYAVRQAESAASADVQEFRRLLGE